MPVPSSRPHVLSLSRRSFLTAAGVAAGAAALPWAPAPARAGSGPYEPTWASIDSHPLPSWFDDVKFGIFIHWGVFSVPAWAPVGEYAEWYPHNMRQKGSPTYEYHRRVYGADFDYRDFIPRWRAENWEPERWADLFRRAGAGYVVPVGEHHDGFPLWDTKTTEWNSVRMGPKRPILRDLEAAVRARGMRFAPSYHGLYNYYAPEYDAPHPDYLSETYLENWMLPQIHEIIENFDADLLWLDGDWMDPTSAFRTKELVAWYYNRALRRDQAVAVNDRLGKVRGEHGDFYTAEYEYNDEQGIAHKWENTRGMGKSFGFNRNEEPSDYLDLDELIRMFVDTVAHWGNVLLNVGPRADGTINEVQRDLLLGLGRWLEVNGEGIYGTTYWRVQKGVTREGLDVRYTVKRGGDDLYVFLFGQPGATVSLPAADLPELRRGDQVRLLGHHGAVHWRHGDRRVVVRMPESGIPDQPVHTLHFRVRRD